LTCRGPHRKRHVQFFYCRMCICYRGNVFTHPLPSTALSHVTCMLVL
jgi:hypothetical protein